MSKSSDNGNELPPPRLWQYLLFRFVFTILQSMFWLFAGGLAWTMGACTGWVSVGEGGVPIGGALGLAVAMTLILGFSNSRNRRVDRSVSSTVAGCGGSAICGLIGLLIVGSNVGVIVGYLLGFVAGGVSFLTRQSLPPTDARLRALASALCGTAIGVLGWQIGGLVGWTIAGAVGLGLMRIVTEFFRPSPIVVVDGDSEVVGEISASERWRTAARDSLRWAIRGALAGLSSGALAHWTLRRAPELGLRVSSWLADAEPALQAAFYAMWLPAVVLFFVIIRLLMAATSWKPPRPAVDTGEPKPLGDPEDAQKDTA